MSSFFLLTEDVVYRGVRIPKGTWTDWATFADPGLDPDLGGAKIDDHPPETLIRADVRIDNGTLCIECPRRVLVRARWREPLRTVTERTEERELLECGHELDPRRMFGAPPRRKCHFCRFPVAVHSRDRKLVEDLTRTEAQMAIDAMVASGFARPAGDGLYEISPAPRPRPTNTTQGK